MKSMLFCTSFIGPDTALRYEKWMDFYRGLDVELGVEHLFLIDDGGSQVDLPIRHQSISPDNLPERLDEKIVLVRFERNLGRSSLADYPGWWRSFLFSRVLAARYGHEKLIHIESDFFVMGPSLLQTLKSTNSGWHGLYSHYYQFPETAIQVICQDQFEALDEVKARVEAMDFLPGKLAEHILPFTEIHKSFQGDRFGELEVIKDWVARFPEGAPIDYFGQLPAAQSLDKYAPFFHFQVAT